MTRVNISRRKVLGVIAGTADMGVMGVPSLLIIAEKRLPAQVLLDLTPVPKLKRPGAAYGICELVR